jgi:hypothetical protein
VARQLISFVPFRFRSSDATMAIDCNGTPPPSISPMAPLRWLVLEKVQVEKKQKNLNGLIKLNRYTGIFSKKSIFLGVRPLLSHHKSKQDKSKKLVRDFGGVLANVGKKKNQGA